MLEGSLRKDAWEKSLESGEKVKQSTRKFVFVIFAKIKEQKRKKSQSEKETLAF